MKKELPSGWKEVRLGDICEYFRGLSYNKQNVVDFGLLVLRSNNIQNYNIDLSDDELQFVNKNCNDDILLKKHDIVICMANGTKKLVGKSAEYKGNYKGKITIGAFCGLLRTKNVLLKYILQTKVYRDYIGIILAGTNINNLRSSELLDFTFQIPTSIDEQKRIAKILSTFDDLIANLTKLIEKKELYKKGVMQRVLTGKVRFNGFTDEWETVRLGDIATITSAGVDKKINDNETKVRLLNYLDVFNRNKLYDNEISFITSANENQIKKCDIKKGDLFITPSSEDREGIAKSAVAMEDFTNVVYSYHIIRLRFNREIDLKFKSYMCDTALFHRQAYRLCDGSGQRYVISLGTFREMEIYIPKSVEEQKKIGELLSLIDQDIDNLKQILQLRKLQKKGVMQKLLTGEVRV